MLPPLNGFFKDPTQSPRTKARNYLSSMQETVDEHLLGRLLPRVLTPHLVMPQLGLSMKLHACSRSNIPRQRSPKDVRNGVDQGRCCPLQPKPDIPLVSNRFLVIYLITTKCDTEPLVVVTRQINPVLTPEWRKERRKNRRSP
jgi:hypothetical protein